MPEDGIRALAAVTRYAQWRAADRGMPVAPVGIDRARAERLLDGGPRGQSRGTRPHPGRGHRELLAAYGIRLWPAVEVRTVEEAVARRPSSSYPVILKSTSPARAPPARARRRPRRPRQRGAGARRLRRLDDRLGPLAPTPSSCSGWRCPACRAWSAATEDPLFGPVVSFSVAGPPTELLGDIAHRIPPLTDVDVADLIDGVKAAPLLHGHRGAAPVHRAALADLIARLSVLADDLPEVASLELNPVNAWTGGVDVLGAEVVISPAPCARTPGAAARCT